MQIQLHSDGGSRGNPGPAGYGYVVSSLAADSPSSNTPPAAIILRKCGNYCGETTNNQAEYLGLIAGLRWIRDHYPHPEYLHIWMDSLLIVNQVKGLYRVKNQELLPRYQEVRALLQDFPKWEISHTYRSGNSAADELVNRAIDERREVTG